MIFIHSLISSFSVMRNGRFFITEIVLFLSINTISRRSAARFHQQKQPAGHSTTQQPNPKIDLTPRNEILLVIYWKISNKEREN